jgi:hypothetical protein
MLITAIHDNFGVSWTVAKTMTATAFAQCGRRGVLNLCDLNEHNKAEHDCSLSRDDANLSGGKQSEFSRQRFQKLLTFSDDGVVLTSRDVVKARIFFYDESRMKNPRFTWNIEQEELMLIETVLLLFVLGDNGAISIADAKSFFENEKYYLFMLRSAVNYCLSRLSISHSCAFIGFLRTGRCGPTSLLGGVSARPRG